MQLQQLRYFVAVAETRNFGRAANRCHVSQPSLSQQIIKLERELGHPLFDRLRRGVLLTEAGEALLPKARLILSEVDGVQEHVSDHLQGGRGRLNVGAIPTIAPYLLPGTLRDFAVRYPEATLSVHESLTEELADHLVNGVIDLAIMSTPPDSDLLDHAVLGEEPFWVCCPSDHPWAKRKRLSLQRLNEAPAIVLHTMHCLGKQTQAFCSQRQITPQLVCYSSQLVTLQQMVSLGLGYSLVPRMCAVNDNDPGRVYIPLEQPEPTRVLAAVWRRGRHLPQVCETYLDTVRENLKEN
jgi:LysR family hydrogen peroxide-inducible transcriptional activator